MLPAVVIEHGKHCHSFSNLDKLSVECQGLIGNYDLVAEVHQARTNLYHTRSELEKMLAIPKRVVYACCRMRPNPDLALQVKEVYGLLKDDQNLLQVHSELKQLERLRDTAFRRARHNAQQWDLLETVFSELGPLREARDERVFAIIRDTLTLAKVLRLLL